MTGIQFLTWRQARGLSQRDIERLFGVRRQTVSLWEANKRYRPIPRPIQLIVEALDTGWVPKGFSADLKGPKE